MLLLSIVHDVVAGGCKQSLMTTSSGYPLNDAELLQDNKLVVATLASFSSGDASNIIKQDLRLIIQSRRRAEGKDELHVEFCPPPKVGVGDGGSYCMFGYWPSVVVVLF